MQAYGRIEILLASGLGFHPGERLLTNKPMTPDCALKEILFLNIQPDLTALAKMDLIDHAFPGDPGLESGQFVARYIQMCHQILKRIGLSDKLDTPLEQLSPPAQEFFIKNLQPVSHHLLKEAMRHAKKPIAEPEMSSKTSILGTIILPPGHWTETTGLKPDHWTKTVTKPLPASYKLR